MKSLRNSLRKITITPGGGIKNGIVQGAEGVSAPQAQILSFTADEPACLVRLTGQGVASSFIMIGPKSYIFSMVYREGATHEAVGLNVKQAGTYTNSCGTSAL